MSRTGMTGSRIRARRLDLDMRQSELADRMGISASYLNLIEHNRRPIAGKLLTAAARALGVDSAMLARGAEAALLDGLRDALAQGAGAGPDMQRAEEFAGRFPDWAALAVAQARRIAALQRTVETLNDRMTHDPFLSAALHDVLSTVTAIRSTSAILADDGDIDAEWQARFHRNLFEDSQRLAESAQGLVGYLDAGGQADTALATPQEELEGWLAGQGYHLAALETGDKIELPEVSGSARQLIAAYADQYRADARALPLADLRRAIARLGHDPARLADHFATDLHRVFRRLAALPEGIAGRPVGLVVCDGSGTLTFRKPVDGFALPRFGAACPLWPLYVALSRPHARVRQLVEQAGQMRPRFTIFAEAVHRHRGGFDDTPVLTAAMLILPHDGGGEGAARPVGTSCRICPRPSCPARREPAIVALQS
ncbi:helix-turn-helix transcriptional regulator [Oceaniglobus trochenteri]|uniref:helix-turn-helix transcriptional regulator n=1 Tax=Oceaniglobus trochenteri TaxID=2763260 RepID=UPI001D00057F|nr:helix-turn-helix transcriptional regulator [Oceaniglobus trochenteri]